MNFKRLLFPFAVVYGIVMQVRNALYDRGFRPSVEFEPPVISIGNLTVGGTGKSPMVEYLIRLLSPEHQVATLSRGYGRSTRGFRIASNDDTPATIGDEPYQFRRKFGKEVTVSVGEERAFAIPQILQGHQGVEVILLDDAFQHRKVRPSLSILLCDYTRPFYDDLILPAGMLRESKGGAARADIIVVTKCPAGIQEETMIEIQHALNEISSKPVFFSGIQYSSPVPFEHTERNLGSTCILVTGIGNPIPLKEHVESNYTVIKHLEFGDHHSYSRKDLEAILAITRAHPDAVVLTTEKDMVKLENHDFADLLKQIPFFYIPITVQFLRDGRDFDELVRDHVSSRLEKNRNKGSHKAQ